MLTPWICNRCRQRLTQNIQQLRRRGFVSLTHSGQNPVDAEQPAGKPPIRTVTKDKRNATDGPRGTSRARSKSTDGRDGSGTSGMDSVLEALFSSNQQAKEIPTRTRYSGIPISQSQVRHQPAPLRRPSPFEALHNQFYNERRPLQETWEKCEELLASEARDDLRTLCADEKGRQTRRLFKDILLSINNDFVQSKDHKGLPLPHSVIKLYLKKAVMPYCWDKVFRRQLASLVQFLYSHHQSSEENRTDAERLEVDRLMEEVIHVWLAFCDKFGAGKERQRNNERGTGQRFLNSGAQFSRLFPRYKEARSMEAIVLACGISQLCWNERSHGQDLALKTSPEGQIFLSLFEELVDDRKFPLGPAKGWLASEGVSLEAADYLFRNMDFGVQPIYTKAPMPFGAPLTNSATSSNERQKTIEELEEEERGLMESIKQTQSLVKSKDALSNAIVGTEERSVQCQDGFQDKAKDYRAATTIIKDLERAVQRHDIARVASIWQKYQQTLAKAELERGSREEIYIHFLTSFFALARQEQAIQVWNDMLKTGISPNQRHWNAMLNGCSKARDAASLQEVWTKMKAAGITPDQVSWTTYIHGLIMGRKWQQGLQALDDLGAHWRRLRNSQITGAQHTTPPVTLQDKTKVEYDPNRPSIVPVHAAVSALLHTGKEEFCLPLLDWALSHSITPTTPFFNLLLRPAARAANPTQTTHILTLMLNQKCIPDSQTYTILLNGLLSNPNSSFPSLPHQEQQSSIFRILDAMTAQNIPIDLRTYSTILYGFLSPKIAAPNAVAARAVLDHMSKNNIQPSTHIYSILISHYFALSPPALPAVESLWKRMKHSSTNLDREFYERMVEGFAKAKQGGE
ncbi:MAG: hypothetical protein Q9220_004387 [cf. Caloplaca sp. 1 TL-2023]